MNSTKLPENPSSGDYIDTILNTTRFIEEDERIYKSAIFSIGSKFYFPNAYFTNNLHIYDPIQDEFSVKKLNFEFRPKTNGKYYTQKYRDNIFFANGDEIIKYNPSTEEVEQIFSVTINEVIDGFHVNDDYIGVTVLQASDDFNYTYSLAISLTSGTTDTIQYKTRTDHFKHFSMVPLIKIENGDVVAYTGFHHIGTYEKYYRSSLKKYNISQKTTVWKVDTMETEGPNASILPFVDEDHVYKLGYLSVFCYDKSTGRLVWKDQGDDASGHYSRAFIFKHGNHVVAKKDNEDLVFLDKHTGQRERIIQDAGYSPSSRYFIVEDMLYNVADANFIGVDLNSMEKSFELKSPATTSWGSWVSTSVYFAIDKDNLTGATYAGSRFSYFNVPKE